MLIRDSLTLDASGLKMTKDGYLIGDAKVSRAGNVQQYYGAELGLTGDDAGKMFGVYRDPDTVFDEDSLYSLAGRPVTQGHPDDLVTADNWSKLAKGQVGGKIVRDGEHVVAPMAIMDATAAKEVADGARSLSAGYTVQIVADEGTAPDGTPYQYRQASPLRFNHVAYLPDNNPRAGNTRIGDEAGDGGKDRIWGARPVVVDHHKGDSAMTDKTTQIVRDGLPVSVPESAAPVIQKMFADADKAIADLQKQLDTANETIKTKDADAAKKDADIDALKAKVLDAAALDAAVQKRADLIDTARKIAPKIETKGVSDADIRKAAVTAERGADAVKDKSEAYIDAAFDILAADAKKDKGDPFASAIGDSKVTSMSDWGDAVFARAGVQAKKGA